MSERPRGFYWVKTDAESLTVSGIMARNTAWLLDGSYGYKETWEPMAWDGTDWYRTGDEQAVAWIEEIGEPVTRDRACS